VLRIRSEPRVWCLLCSDSRRRGGKLFPPVRSKTICHFQTAPLTYSYRPAWFLLSQGVIPGPAALCAAFALPPVIGARLFEAALAVAAGGAGAAAGQAVPTGVTLASLVMLQVGGLKGAQLPAAACVPFSPQLSPFNYPTY